MTDIPDKRLFWPREAAELLGVHPATVYRRIEDGTIPTHLKIKPYKIRRETIEEILSHDSQ